MDPHHCLQRWILYNPIRYNSFWFIMRVKEGVHFKWPELSDDWLGLSFSSISIEKCQLHFAREKFKFLCKKSDFFIYVFFYVFDFTKYFFSYIEYFFCKTFLIPIETCPNPKHSSRKMTRLFELEQSLWGFFSNLY